MTAISPQSAPIFIDYTHCGRHVTGLERITLELFSANALAPLQITPVRSKTRLGMIARQNLQLPLQALTNRGSLLVCPGFPPAHLATAMLGARVLPYIHDLFLMTRKSDLNIRARWIMAPPFRYAVQHLPHFLVNSQTTADELRRFCRPDAQITLYRPEVRDVFSLSKDKRSDESDHDGPALVALGTIEPRKNLFLAAQIITLLRSLGHKNARLDIVGRPGWGVDIAALSAIPGIILHGYQPQERVRDILLAGDALISTSHDEGLGLPLLEAQYGGLMVIAPDKPVFREVLGDSGLLIDPDSAAVSAARISSALSASNWRLNHAASAAANLIRWNQTAAQDRAAVIALLTRLTNPKAAASC